MLLLLWDNVVPKLERITNADFYLFICLFLQNTSLDSCIRLLYKIVFYSKMLSRAADTSISAQECK